MKWIKKIDNGFVPVIHVILSNQFCHLHFVTFKNFKAIGKIKKKKTKLSMHALLFHVINLNTISSHTNIFEH